MNQHVSQTVCQLNSMSEEQLLGWTAVSWTTFQLIIIIVVIIKTSSTFPSWKNKIVYKLHTQSHKHLRHGKTEKQTQGSNERLTAPLNPSNFPVSNTVWVRSPHTSLGRQETPCKLGRSTPWYLTLDTYTPWY